MDKKPAVSDRATSFAERARLTIPRRLALLVAAAVVASMAAFAVQLTTLRQTIVEERRVAIKNEVETAVSVARAFAADAASGKLPDAEAQERAKAVLRSMRFGVGDYFFAYRYDGVNVVHGLKPENEGKQMMEVRDANGVRLNAEVIDAARRGGAYTSFLFARAGQDTPSPKLAYSAGVEPWQWAVGSGVYIDDIDTIFRARLVEAGFWSAGLLLFLGLTAWPISRSIAKPVRELTGAMTALAAGDTRVTVPAAERADEVGDMARAVSVFKASMIEADRLRADQEEQKAQAAAEQKAALDRVAGNFEASLGGIIGGVAAASTEMEQTARAMLSTAEHAGRQTDAVSAATSQASANVQTVASAAEELSASIEEIGRQVGRSSKIAQDAAHQAARTNETVSGLAATAQRIGDVVSLIHGIAGQTNLLALNATIEAARAGEHGKGFAVVASEVKALATQTARATEEIAQQVSAIQSATGEAVSTIEAITATIGQVNEIAGAIAAAVEQQGAATREIAGNVQQAAQGTTEVASHVAGVTQSSHEVGTAASQVLGAAGELARQSQRLRDEVAGFLDTIRAA